MISILMPIYNGIKFIDESVTSVLEQTYTQWELLIAINGHPENSQVYKIAKKFEEKSNKIKVFYFYKIKGKANTLNEMI
jgi:glycosyltransferase involved in cell wall biosynthesis